MILILIIASVISAVMAKIDGTNDYIESIIIIAIVVFNAIMGLVQESKAEKSLESLKKMSAPTSKVIRDGNVSIIDSENGVPGEKNARLNANEITGTIDENTTQGIFGDYTNTLPNKKQYKVAKPNEIHTGKATLMTVLNGTEVKEYEINITKINNNMSQKNKNILFTITDSELLEKTGGIVQGMSGSPIIQDEKIIAAVTHVVVNDPTRGYGIFITNMLEEAEN